MISGFEKALGLDQLMDTIQRTRSALQSDTFPPYSFLKRVVDGKLVEYRIELAVAGFTRDEISVSVEKKNDVNLLTIKGAKNEKDSEWSIVQSGIAYRPFERQFTLGLALEVQSVSLNNGILTISALMKERPQASVKTFDIS